MEECVFVDSINWCYGISMLLFIFTRSYWESHANPGGKSDRHATCEVKVVLFPASFSALQSRFFFCTVRHIIRVPSQRPNKMDLSPAYVLLFIDVSRGLYYLCTQNADVSGCIKELLCDLKTSGTVV